jgi:hypothetical protein
MSGRPTPPTDHDAAAVFAQLSGVIGAVSRVEIVFRTGLADRTVREAVAALVARGIPIVTDRSAGGYELTWNSDRLKTEIGRLKSHASRILERANALEMHLS